MHTPLTDVLGATWTLDATVNALAWSGRQAAFALSDGSVAIARGGWEGSPAARLRDGGGGVELLPAVGPPPPLARAALAPAPCLSLTSAGDDFLVGSADGVLRRVNQDGQPRKLAKFDGRPVTSVAWSKAGWACIAGGAVHMASGQALEAIIDPRALARHGGMLAIAHAGGVSLRDRGTTRLAVGGSVRRLVFSPTGGQIAIGMKIWRVGAGAPVVLNGAAGEPLDIAFSSDARLLVHAGESGVQCWNLGPGVELDGPATPLGAVSNTPALAVAFHPRRPLLAIAHASGAVTLGLPRAGQTLLLCPVDASPVHSLAFDASGEWLAMGGAACALVRLPDLLFREGARSGVRESAA
ncbi:WD40 repeat domain-containing protein [Rhodopila sp.]|uniref:WD40 repeat domain-containing protein n=1 Tax=Rhodopila sp. TaxID=2480087 RepID=UPI003D0BB012